MRMSTTSSIPYIYHHKLSSSPSSNDDKDSNDEQADKKYVFFNCILLNVD